MQKDENLDNLDGFYDNLPEQLRETYQQILDEDNEIPVEEITESVLKLPEPYKSLLKASKGATAEEIATLTARKRPVESDYLNQLHNMNLVLKYRIGKKVYFTLNWITPVGYMGAH